MENVDAVASCNWVDCIYCLGDVNKTSCEILNNFIIGTYFNENLYENFSILKEVEELILLLQGHSMLDLIISKEADNENSFSGSQPEFF